MKKKNFAPRLVWCAVPLWGGRELTDAQEKWLLLSLTPFCRKL
jgi:hypothetical protein